MYKASKLAPDVWRRVGLADVAIPVRVANDLDNAFVNGYFRPRIWIGRSQLESPALGSILQHELMHVRQRDNFVLLLVTLLTDLFWWNPLVRVLIRQARRYVELSCDRGYHIFLDLGFQVAGTTQYVSLAPNIGEWTGVTVGEYLLRIKPDLLGDRGQETVLLSTEVSQIGEGKFNLIATPSLRTEFGHEAVMRLGRYSAWGNFNSCWSHCSSLLPHSYGRSLAVADVMKRINQRLEENTLTADIIIGLRRLEMVEKDVARIELVTMPRPQKDAEAARR